MTSNPIFITHAEAAQLNTRLAESSLIGASLRRERAELDAFLEKPFAVPGSGPAGGNEHEQHKANYTQIFNAGKFWLITGEPRYRDCIRDLLLLYAAIYPGLPFAKPYTPNPPGKLFHQILNEHMWLVFVSAGYSCVRADLSPQERTTIETGVFQPMVEMFSRTYQHHFDIIHNHGIWAVTAVGLAGMAVDHAPWVDMAIHGQRGDSKSGGFLAQLSQLFSPTGYYEEGPYYQRFALQPLLLFAEAIERSRPDLQIYEFRQQLVRRALYAPLYASFPDGRLVPVNDANRDMDIRSLGFLIGAAYALRRYGQDMKLLWLTDLLQSVWVDIAGLQLSDAWAASSAAERRTSFSSVELTCGVRGEKGALGILRVSDASGDQHVVTLNYGTHGMPEHGHFDGLTLGYYNRNQEVLRDYGCVRWLNVEPKSGGCYVDENRSWAKQTIAHNCVTVDERCQHDGDGELASAGHATSAWFIAGNQRFQAMSGHAEGYYPGVTMQRTAMLYQDEHFTTPLLIDIHLLDSAEEHQYDYAIHYDGQLVRTDFPVDYAAAAAPVVGRNNGYQHLWQIASGQFAGECGLFSWLQGHSYYSLTTWAGAGAQALFTRLGAHDPQFNLRSEPGYIVRRRAKRQLFVSVLETHGAFDQRIELSRQARGLVERIELIGETADASALRIITQAGPLLVLISHRAQVAENEILSGDFAGHTWQWAGGVCVRTG